MVIIRAFWVILAFTGFIYLGKISADIRKSTHKDYQQPSQEQIQQEQ